MRSTLNSIKLIVSPFLASPSMSKGNKNAREETTRNDFVSTIYDATTQANSVFRLIPCFFHFFFFSFPFLLVIFPQRTWHSYLYPPISIRDVNAVISQGNYWAGLESNAFERRGLLWYPLPTVLPWNYWMTPESTFVSVSWINVSASVEPVYPFFFFFLYSFSIIFFPSIRILF